MNTAKQGQEYRSVSFSSPKSISRLTGCGLVLAAALFVHGCGPGSGDGLDEDGNLMSNDSGNSQQSGNNNGGGNTGGGNSGNPNATLDWVQARVFGGVCTECHRGANAPMGVKWSSPAETCGNVGRSSQWEPSMNEIESGNPDGSYVVWKIEGQGPAGEPIQGVQMPMAKPPLSTQEIQNIRDWIADGTLDCAGSRSARDSGSGGPGISAYPEGSWLYVREQSLQQCSNCHSLEPTNPSCSTDLQCPPAGVVLTADNYFGLLDGSTVVPGNPAASALWRRIADKNPDTRTHYALEPLAQWQQDLIRDWISDGAPEWPAPDR